MELNLFLPLNLTSEHVDYKANVEAFKRVQEIQGLHETIKSKIEQSNASYKTQANEHRRQVIFNPRDLI